MGPPRIQATTATARLVTTTATIASRRSSHTSGRRRPSLAKLPYVAAKTLAVVASLWSPSFSPPYYSASSSSSSSMMSPEQHCPNEYGQYQYYYPHSNSNSNSHSHSNCYPNPHHRQQQPPPQLLQEQRYWNDVLPPFSLLLPQVSAFQPKRSIGIPRMGGQARCQEQWPHHRQRQNHHHHQQQQQNYPQCNSFTLRWYHTTSPGRYFSSTTAMASSNDEFESIPSTPNSNSNSTSTVLSTDQPHESATTIDPAAVSATRHLPRLFVESTQTPLQPRSLIPITAHQEHYLLDVMRITNPKRWGKEYTGCLRIFNGADGEWLAKVVVADPDGSEAPKRKRKPRKGAVSSSSPGSTVLECVEVLRPQAATGDDAYIHLHLGYLRDKQRRRWVFEKATELGVESVRLLETDFCNNNDRDSYKKKSVRWEDDCHKHKLHVIEAAEQSERLTVPTVGEALGSVDAIAQQIRAQDHQHHLWLVCVERSETSPPILSVLQESASMPMHQQQIHVLVGPEGGWSPRELDVFSSLDDHVRFVSLGSSVLRAETAAIAAVASVQMHASSRMGF